VHEGCSSLLSHRSLDGLTWWSMGKRFSGCTKPLSVRLKVWGCVCAPKCVSVHNWHGYWVPGVTGVLDVRH
jgi:hypothetical protein